MVKRSLSVLLTVLMTLSLIMVPAMGVSANVEKVDIADYTPNLDDDIITGAPQGSENTAGITSKNLSGTTYTFTSINAEAATTGNNDILQPMRGIQFTTPVQTLQADVPYVLQFVAKKGADSTADPNLAFGFIDGAKGGSAAGWGWTNQWIYTEKIESTEGETVSKLFTLKYPASSSTQFKIGMTTGNSNEAYAGKEEYAYIPGAVFTVDYSKVYLAPERAYDVENTISMTKAMPGAVLKGNAKVVNQIGITGNLDQNITYFVTDTEGNVVDGVSVAEGTNGSYTATVDANAADGDYVITARAAAYNTTENFMQHSVTLTVEDVDYSDTNDIVTENLLGTSSDIKFGHTVTTAGDIATVTAGESATANESIARPAGGLDWTVSTEIRNNDVFVATTKVKKANSGDVNPNFIMGLVDATMGGKNFNPTYSFLGQYLNTQDIEDDTEWITVKHYMQIKNVAVDVYTPSSLHFVVGIGAGNKQNTYKNKPAFEFRSGASMSIDKSAVYLAKETLKGIANEAVGSTSVFPGQSISARARVVNNIDDTGSLDQTMEYIVLDRETRKQMTNDITITTGADGNYTINVGEDAEAGDYVAVATNLTNGTTLRKGLEFTVETIDKYIEEYQPAQLDSIFDGRGEVSKVTGFTVDLPAATNNYKYVVKADPSRDDSSIPSTFQSVAAGARIFIGSGAMIANNTYVISFKVKNISPDGVVPNVVFGILDKAQGGGTPDWNWLGQYVSVEEVTTKGEWTTITQRVTPKYNSSGTSYLLVGLGAGNTHETYNGKENIDFRANAAIEIDHSSAFMVAESVYDVEVASEKDVVRAGANVDVDAKVVNQIGQESDFAQNFSWVALNASKTDMAEGITITPSETDSSKVNVSFDRNVEEGEYVIVAYAEDYKMARHIKIKVSNTTTVENVAVDTANKTVTFDALNVAADGMNGAVYVAEYVPGADTFVKAEKVAFTLTAGDTIAKEVEYTLEIAEGNELRVYIWDNNLTPYIQPVSKKNN